MLITLYTFELNEPKGKCEKQHKKNQNIIINKLTKKKGKKLNETISHRYPFSYTC